MSTTSTAIYSNPLFATYSVYARNASFGLGLEEKVLQFFKTFVVILDGSEQGTPWHHKTVSVLVLKLRCIKVILVLNEKS